MDEIDPIYFDKAYYVNPVGGEKAFNVLLAAMEKLNKAGIAKTVLGIKETLVLIRARNGKMLVNTLYFFNEVQKSPIVKKSKIEKQELDLAINLINQMTQPFKPEKYKDEYNEKIRKAIKRKIEGNDIVQTKEKSQPAKIINLMEALQKSLKTTESKPKSKQRA